MVVAVCNHIQAVAVDGGSRDKEVWTGRVGVAGEDKGHGWRGKEPDDRDREVGDIHRQYHGGTDEGAYGTRNGEGHWAEDHCYQYQTYEGGPLEIKRKTKSFYIPNCTYNKTFSQNKQSYTILKHYCTLILVCSLCVAKVSAASVSPAPPSPSSTTTTRPVWLPGVITSGSSRC